MINNIDFTSYFYEKKYNIVDKTIRFSKMIDIIDSNAALE